METRRAWRKGPGWVSQHPAFWQGLPHQHPTPPKPCSHPRRVEIRAGRIPIPNPPTTGVLNLPSRPATLLLRVRACAPAWRHPGVLPGLGDPQHLLLPEHPDAEGALTTGTRLGQRSHPAAGQQTRRRGAGVAQPPQAPCVTEEGMRRGPGPTCACGSCGSEREGGSGRQTSAWKGSWGGGGGLQTPRGLPSTQAEAGGCHGEGDTSQGFTMRKV